MKGFEKMRKRILLPVLLGALLLGNVTTAFADEEHGAYATSGEMAQVQEVEKYGMTPIAGSLIKDGTWEIEVESSSSFFIVENCALTVENGEMTARMEMYSYSYDLLYLGSAEEAADAAYEDYIEYEDIDDWCVFTIPVEALNKPIPCAAYSKQKEKWYYREILFDASTLDEEALNGLEIPDYDLIGDALENYESGQSSEDDATGQNEQQEAMGGSMDVDNPAYGEAMEIDLEDGRYSIEVAMTGGSGRATVSTPTLLIVEDGKAYARLLWSSTYYEWMRVGGTVYDNETEDGGNSTFTIPISSLDSLIPVVACTTAMGDEVPIEYTLTFYRESIGDEGLIPQEAAKKVVIVAVIIIVGGFFLNLFVKKMGKRN